MDRRAFHRLGMAALLTPMAQAAPPQAAAPQAAPTQAAPPQAPAPQTAEARAGNPFSVMLWTLPRQLTFIQRLEMAAAAGYGSVEVGNEYERWEPEEWDANLAALERTGLGVDAAVPGRNPLADHAQRTALRDDLRRAVPGAKRLGCSQFIYTAYKRVAGLPAPVQQAAIADSLKYAADLLEAAGIGILLEPIDLLEHRDEAVTSVAQAFEIIRLVGSERVRVLYDFYHEQREAGNLIEKLAGNIQAVGLVHIADVPGRHQPDTGEINYGNIFRELARLRYTGTICMEFIAEGDPPAALKKARLNAVQALTGVAG